MDTHGNGAQPVSVRILDKEYLVACGMEEVAELRLSAQYLDQRMKEIRDSGKVVGTDRIAVMAALNIAHDLLKSHTFTEQESNAMMTRIRNLQDKIEAALERANPAP